MEKTILEKPDTRSVVLGGAVHVLGEMRPCDIPAVIDFVDGLADTQSLAGMAGIAKADDPSRLLDLVKNMGRSQPKAACELLVAVLDKDPMGEDGTWRKAKLAELMALPLTELTTALGAWVELNRSFFGRQALPLILGSAKVWECILAEVATLAKLQEEAPSKAGNASC